MLVVQPEATLPLLWIIYLFCSTCFSFTFIHMIISPLLNDGVVMLPQNMQILVFWMRRVMFIALELCFWKQLQEEILWIMLVLRMRYALTISFKHKHKLHLSVENDSQVSSLKLLDFYFRFAWLNILNFILHFECINKGSFAASGNSICFIILRYSASYFLYIKQAMRVQFNGYLEMILLGGSFR